MPAKEYPGTLFKFHIGKQETIGTSTLTLLYGKSDKCAGKINVKELHKLNHRGPGLADNASYEDAVKKVLTLFCQ